MLATHSNQDVQKKGVCLGFVHKSQYLADADQPTLTKTAVPHTQTSPNADA